MKTYRGVELQLHMFLTLVLDESKWLSSCPGSFTPVLIWKEAEWVPQPVWMWWQREKSLPLPGSNHGHPVCSSVNILTKLPCLLMIMYTSIQISKTEGELETLLPDFRSHHNTCCVTEPTLQISCITGYLITAADAEIKSIFCFYLIMHQLEMLHTFLL